MVMPCPSLVSTKNVSHFPDRQSKPDISCCLDYVTRALLGEELPDNNIKKYLTGMDCPHYSRDVKGEYLNFFIGADKWVVSVNEENNATITVKNENDDSRVDKTFPLTTPMSLSTLSASLFEHLLPATQALTLKDIFALSTGNYLNACFDLSSKIFNAFLSKSYFSAVSEIDPQSKFPCYAGDTDGGVMGPLYAMFMTNRLSFREEALPLLQQLTDLEQQLFDAMSQMVQSGDETALRDNSFWNKINKRDEFLNKMIPYIVVNPDAVTPCVFTGDMVNDRLSSPYSDSILLKLIADTGSVLLAGDHETCFKGNYLGLTFPNATQNNFPAIRNLDFMYYDNTSGTVACHNGVTIEQSDEGTLYLAGPYSVRLSSLKNPYDPAELVNAFNKYHRKVMNAAATHETLWSYSRYTDFSVGNRPSEENLLRCARTLRIHQIHGHNGYAGIYTDKGHYVIDLNARVQEKDTNKTLYGLQTFQFTIASPGE